MWCRIPEDWGTPQQANNLKLVNKAISNCLGMVCKHIALLAN